MTAAAPPERRRAEATHLLRLITGLTAGVLGWYAGVLGDARLVTALGGAALLLLPLDVLPALVLLTIRDGEAVVGFLCPSDLVALVYLTRLVLGLQALRLRVTASRAALAAFLLWTAVMTFAGFGLLSALARIAVYAAVGVAVTYRARGKAYLFAAVVGLAVVEIALYIPQAPARLYGVIVNDPTHAGGLFIAALLIVLTSRLPLPVRLALGLLLVFGIAMTMTRVIWFASAIVVVAALLPRRWWVPLALPPLAGATLLPLVPWVTGAFGLDRRSAGLRLRGIAAGWHQFAQRPLTGHGWAYAPAAHETGLAGVDDTAVYDLWVYVGVCAGVVGVLLFLAFTALLAREATGDPVAYLFLVAAMAMSLTEMFLYGASLLALLFFTMTSARGAPPGGGQRAGEGLPIPAGVARRPGSPPLASGVSVSKGRSA